MNLPEPGPILVGPSGWAHEQWQNIFYPNAKSKNFHQLEFTSRFFDTVEVAASYFSPLRPEISQLWTKQVQGNPRFQFALRTWRQLVQSQRLEAKDVAAFREGIRPIEESGKLGAVLIQFPASFRFSAETRQRVIDLRRALKGLPLVAEFRHSSWMEDDALALLIDYHLGFANIDQSPNARAMPPTAFLTSPVGYVRFCGRNPAGSAPGAAYRYSLEELADWMHRIRKVNRYSKRTFIVMANDAGASSLVNGFQMKDLLGQGETRAPRELVRRFHRDLSHVRPDQPLQTDLFASLAA